MEKRDNPNEAFLALLHEERLRILGLLAIQEMRLPALANQARLSTRQVLTHMQMLQHFNLVSETQAGAEVVYALNRKTLQDLAQGLLPAERRAPTQPLLPLDILDEEERKLVWGYFNRDGTLKEIPYAAKKQKALVRYLSQAFAPGRVYREKEINAALERFHPDYATLRRFLVDFGYLLRTATGSEYQLAGDVSE